MEGDGDNLQIFQSRRSIGSRQSQNTTSFYSHGSAQARRTQKESVSLDVLGCWLTWFGIVLFVLASRCAKTVCLSVCLSASASVHTRCPKLSVSLSVSVCAYIRCLKTVSLSLSVFLFRHGVSKLSGCVVRTRRTLIASTMRRTTSRKYVEFSHVFRSHAWDTLGDNPLCVGPEQHCKACGTTNRR